VVPTTGFIVEDARGALCFSSDTGPTDRFWQVVNATRRVKAVITETSFPNELQDLANVSAHLTPRTLGDELRKLEHDVPVYLYGFKPRHVRTIRAQVATLRRKRLYMLSQGKTYRF
jgi:cAMP phosphodiesterase